MKPDSVNILGIEYSITYCDNPSDVDRNKRDSLWGQIDYWERKIRIYENERTPEDILQTLLHEIIHGIDTALHMNLEEAGDLEDRVDLLALALADVLIRNKWIELDNEK
jgi:hypothetical protein